MSVLIAWWVGMGTATTIIVIGGGAWLHHKDRLDKVIAAIRGQ